MSTYYFNYTLQNTDIHIKIGSIRKMDQALYFNTTTQKRSVGVEFSVISKDRREDSLSILPLICCIKLSPQLSPEPCKANKA